MKTQNKIKILGVGDFAASNSSDEMLKTFGLGSCVAVIILHPATKTAGMVHVALPESTVSPAKVKSHPGYFADTGIPALLQLMATLGCKNGEKGKGMVVKLAGGAKVLDPDNIFNIGKRNVLAVKKVLWSYGLGPIAEDVGGNFSRTVTVAMDTGKITLSSPGKKDWHL
ncbi:MAG: chemotaxis protein CheD [Desulfobulbaceae bacterium]|nr:chemotaxis protein CheD [Desulfobulbaceae bacterium]